MAKVKTSALLNQLFEILHRSLSTYLADACPWTHTGDERATKALADIVADQKAMSGRIAELIDSRGDRVESGHFPMEYTDLNLLSLDYLIRELIACQKCDLADIESIVTALGGDREARELAEEVLGAERAHLESLEELAKQPA